MGSHDAEKKILTSLLKRSLCLCLIFLCVFSLVAPTTAYGAIRFDREVDTYAQSVFMQSLDTGEVIYEKASDVRRSPASLTKIMTALLILENCAEPSRQTVTVPEVDLFGEIIAEGGVNIALQPGETLTVEDLLYAVMLPSACDAAQLLAWHFGDGSVEKFVAMMNDRASEMGLENTHFANPHGLEAQMHYSTASDIAAILKEAMTHELFRKIIGTLSYTIPQTEKHEARTVNYTIAMLSPGSMFYYPGMTGVKSGYTSQAGRCLASTASRDSMSYLLIVMGANLDPDQQSQGQNLSYSDTKALYDYAFANFTLREAVRQGEEYHLLNVNGGTESTVSLVAKESVSVLCYKNSELRYVIDAPEIADAPLSGQAVGTLSVYMGEECLVSVDLLPASEVAAVAPTVTRKPSPYTASGEGNIFLNDSTTVILLLSLAVIVLLTILAGTLMSLGKAGKKRK